MTADGAEAREAAAARPRRRLALALRVAVSAALVAWLLGRVDALAALRLLGTARGPLLAGAVASVLATHALNCLRWRWCMLDEGRRVRFRTLVFSYWTSLFAGLALPGEYGGDVLRSKDAWDRLESGSAAVASVLWSRLSGLVAVFVVLAVVGAGRLEELAEKSLAWIWAISVAMCAALAIAVFWRPVHDLARRLVERFSSAGRARDGALRVLTRVRVLATHRFYAWRIVALALAAQVLMIGTNTLYAWALGLPVSVSDMALVVPLVTVSSMLPVSIGGIGVKEGAFVVCLSAVGVTPEGALSLALLNRVVLLALTLAGGGLFPFRRRLLESGRPAATRAGTRR